MEEAEHGAVKEQLEVFRRRWFQMFEQILSHVLLIEMEQDEPARRGHPTGITIESGETDRKGQVGEVEVNVDVRVGSAHSGVMTTEDVGDFVVRFESESLAQTRAYVMHELRQPTTCLFVGLELGFISARQLRERLPDQICVICGRFCGVVVFEEIAANQRDEIPDIQVDSG